MNIMTSEKFAELEQDAATETNPALKKLMEQWEKKLFKNARRAGGFGMIAVTLAACGGNGGSGSGDGENGGGENGGENGGGTTPIPDGGTFTVLNFPTEVESGLFFQTGSGGLAPVADLVGLLTGALEAINAGTGEGNVDVSDVQLVLDEINQSQGNSGDIIINVAGSGEAQDFATLLNTLIDSGFLEGIEQVDVTSVGRIILTPDFNSGDTTPVGPNGELNTGVPAEGDDTILMGRTELLHGAIIDAGDGSDTLRITAKGPYAQPALVANVETIEINNQPNSSLSQLPEDINTTDIINGAVTSTDFLLADTDALPDFSVANFNVETDSWIDLGMALDIETLRISQSGGSDQGDGDLFVIGVNNSATLQITGGFDHDLIVDYGFGGGDAITVVLNNVNFADSSLLVGQNSTALIFESTGGDGAVENFIHDGFFGPNLRDLTITGDTFLHIEGAVDFNTGRPTTIDAGANTGGVKLTAVNNEDGESLANNTINVTGSQGDDDFTLTADAFDITSGAGSNTFDLTGSYTGDLFNGMELVFDGSAGEDTIILNGADGPFGFQAMLAGSAITGADNTLVLNGSFSLTEASLEGVTAVNMAPGAYLALTPAQVADLGAGAFSVIDGAEAVASLDSNFFTGQETPVLSIVLDQDATLADLIDVSALDSGVKLAFRIPEDVTLTLTAEELHEHVADPGIWMGNDDTNPLESVGNLVITDAGDNFSISNSGAVDAPGEPFFPGGGTVFSTTGNNNVTVERSDGGFERPSQVLEDDTRVIDSSDGPVVVGPNDFGNDDEFTIPQTTTLIMTGANDITFTAPVSFAGQTGFTIDFSEVEGVVSDLEIVDFQFITPGANTDGWGQVIGNGGARIDVQLDGNVGNANNGLISSGVATYVVTDLNEGDHQFWTSTPTEDLETLGLQGNYGNGITFGNVIAGVDFLMEVTSDKFDPAYSVGELTAVFARDDVADAVVNVVGLEDLPEGEVQTVEGITLGAVNGNDAASATINVAGGDTIIESLTGEFPALTITGDADVTVEGDLPITLTDIDASGVVGVFTGSINNPDEDFSFLGAEGGTVLTLEDVDGENTIDGGVGGAELVIEGTVDLSESTLSNITSVTMNDLSDLTMTPQQVIDLGGLSGFNIEDGDTADLTLTVTEDFNVDDLDLENLPDGLTLDLSLQSEVELNITGEQLADLLEAGVAITDGSGGDPAGTLNITGFTQANLQDADGGTFDYFTGTPAILPDDDIFGTITTDGSDLFVPSAYDDDFGGFAWELEGGTLGLSDQDMADGLVVNNGDIQFFFVPSSSVANPTGDPIDASEYTAIGTLSVNEFGLPATYNIESITFLDSATEVEIVPLVSPEFDGVDRTLIVGGVPFAIDESGAPFNPGTGDAGPVTTGVNLDFDNVSGDSNRNVETVTIAFQEGGNIVGAITIGDGELPGAGNAFETLTLISNGDDVNTILGDISAGANNNLLTVNIQANQDLVIGDDPVTPTQGTIILSSSEAGAAATVTITGDADVTVKGIDASDSNIATLTVDTSGHTGTYTVAGGSPSIDAGETLVFVGGVDSTVELDTADGPGAGNLGVDGEVDGTNTLTLIDASGMEGTLALGDVDNVADGFTLTGGTGVITGNILTLPPVSGGPAPFTGNWLLDISGSAAGSQIDLDLDDADADAGAASLTSGSLSLATDEDTGETTLTFGDTTTLVIAEPLDLSGFNNVVFGADVVIELGEDGLVTMSDEQFADFDAAGGTITGETAKTFDAGIDLQDVRGLTEINIEDDASGLFTLSSEQVADARTVDGDDPAIDPPSDFGDIQAINDAVDLDIVVKDGATFEVTDNEIDSVDIAADATGDGTGAVVTTMEGTAGATLDVDAADDDLPGQSITVNYTLDGVAGSVVLSNTATNFTSASLVEAALAGSLDAVTGLNASPAGGIVTVEADEPGVEFVVTGVDVTGTNGMEIATETFVDSTADMSGNTVADTTHVFPTLGAPAFYTVTGTLGGDETIEIEGDNFIDLTGATLPTGTDDSINLTGGAEIKVAPGLVSELVVTGDGSLQADANVAAAANQDYSGIDVPFQINVNNGAGFTLTGATLFNPDQPLTLVDGTGSPAPGPVFDITGIDGANNVPSLNRPSEVELDNVDLTLTAAQGDGLVVTGASEATVILDPAVAITSGSNNADLSGMDVPVEIEAVDDIDFGGALPSGQPITFSSPTGTQHTITLNANTIPAAAVVFIAADTTLDVTGGTLGADVEFIMEGASSVLTITGAQADGTSIEGAPDINGDPQTIGTVDIVDLDGTEDLSGIDGPTLQLTFADDVDEGSVAATAVDGRTITIAGGDNGAADFTLTVTGLEEVPGADLTGLTLSTAVGAGSTDVVVELDSTGDVTIADTADLTIAGPPNSVTLSVTGDGTVDVADGANLSGVGAFEVGADATLVVDQSLTDANSQIALADVSGEGTLEVTGFDGTSPALSGSDGGDTANIDFVTFTFDGDADYATDGPVTINDFLAGGSASRDQIDLNDILDVQSVSTSANKANLEGANDGAILILTSDLGANATTKGGMETEFGSDVFGANDSENILVTVDAGSDDWNVWLWQDGVNADGGGANVNSDGEVGESELTLIANVDAIDTLGNDNFVV